MKDFVPFLRSVDIFKELDTSEVELLSEFMNTRTFDDGEFVFTQNSKGRVIYIVKEGELILNITGSKSLTFGQGDMFGEMALINDNIRMGSVYSNGTSELLTLNGDLIIDNSKIPPEIAIKLIKAMARKVTGYLRSREHTSTLALIKEGEDELIEFKSTLRYNMHTKKFGKEIEHASLKSIAAFLNTAGGTLLIGVNDDMEITGIENDKFDSDDRAMLHLTNLVKEKISIKHMAFVDLSVEDYDGKKILRADVSPSTIPAYVSDNKNDSFYIRTGPSTSDLRVSEIYDYIKSRFN